MTQKEPNDYLKLYDELRNTLGAALVRAMAVANEDEDGLPTKLSQTALSEQTKVARSTISKYLSGGDAICNPDLRTICRLAHALNVPPALLLMRPDDWKRLASIPTFLTMAIKNTEVQALSSSDDSQSSSTSRRRALDALKIARRIGAFVDQPAARLPRSEGSTNASDLADEQDAMTKRIRKGVLTTCALPPLGLLEPAAAAPLISICAVLGAST